MMVYIYRLIYCCLFLFSLSTNAQVQNKKQLTVNDYGLWSSLERTKISPDGKWISFYQRYESGNDTLVIKQVGSSKTIAFPKGKNESFNDQNHIALIDENNDLILLNLKNQNSYKVKKVKKFEFVNKGNQIVLLRMEENKKMALEIIELNGNRLHTSNDVLNFSVSPNGNRIIYNSKNREISSVGWLEVGKKIMQTLMAETEEGEYLNPVWQTNGESVAFVLKKESSMVFLYDFKQLELYSFNIENFPSWPTDMTITAFQRNLLYVADKSDKVFFLMTEKSSGNNKPDAPQIWKSNDSYIYPLNQVTKKNQLGIWHPHSNRFQFVGDSYEKCINLADNQNVIISADEKPYLPTSKREGDSDIYMTNLNSGTKKLLIKQYPSDYPKVASSPSGKFLAYFKNDNWWVYDIESSQHYNITKDTPTSFSNETHDEGTAPAPYGIAGWSPDEKTVFIYDRFDIWAFSPDSNNKKRITKGREKQVGFRFEIPFENKYTSTAFFKPLVHVFDLKKSPILLAKTEDYNSTGIFSLSEGNSEKKIIYLTKSIKNITKAKTKDCYLFTVQDADLPPMIMVQAKDDKTPKNVFQTNKHHSQFGTSKSKLIEFSTSSGKKINGVLFYPFNYNPDIKYPMVVYVYEKLTPWIHTYVNPTVYDEEGFNRTNFTSQGYFVLYPDIHYQLGNAPYNAVEQVVEATQKAIATANIDADKMGIIGHSFGGYETNFIITQTNIFKAAVSGASIVDNISMYLSMKESLKKPRYFMSEYMQQRLPYNLFDNWLRFLDTSPIYYAKKIQTPLLTWSGDLDTTVPHSQTMMLYYAMRRLNKKNTMIIYPNEEHALFNPSNQLDLNTKIQNWFDHYLKGKPLLPEL